MMSLLALTGLAAFEMGGIATGENPENADIPPEDFAEEDTLHLDARFEDTLMAHVWDEADFEPGDEYSDPDEDSADQISLDRGSEINIFDPSVDVLELEYTSALGTPEITILDFKDGTGASVALNGVVVADVTGAQGMDPGQVALKAV